MRVVAVPNALNEHIQAKITEQLAGRPITDSDRECLFNQLLAYFDEHGVVPAFTIAKLDASAESAEGKEHNTSGTPAKEERNGK